jgi:hypothetical protein
MSGNKNIGYRPLRLEESLDKTCLPAYRNKNRTKEMNEDNQSELVCLVKAKFNYSSLVKPQDL